MQTIDRTTPGARWQFDGAVTDAFEDMLTRSIPQYEVMRHACFELGNAYAQDATDIVDLGCSRGEALWPFTQARAASNRYVGCEASHPMLDAARARYADNEQVEIRECDLRREFPACEASIILSILTVQFTPIEYRQRILRDVYKHLTPGGAFIFVEKILGATAEIDAQLVTRYYALKAEHDYSQEDIERKRLSLEGVLVPVTARWNEELLRQAGFTQVDCFWRWMNFAGWVAVKD